jgi:hypothetical protein
MEIAARIEKLIPNLGVILSRFPVSAAYSVLLCLVLNAGNGWNGDDNAVWAGSAAFLASGAVHLFAESRRLERLPSIIIATAAGLVAGGAGLLSGLLHTSLLFLFCGLVLALMVAAYLKPGIAQGALWLFNFRLGLAALLAFVVALLFAAGLSAIVEALRFLFDAPLPSALHDHIWITAASLVAPLYGLSLVSKDLDETVDIAGQKNTLLERGVSVLVNYVLVPVIVVYAVILHAYAIKIALQGELPKGQIGTMVTIFALGGTGAWLIAWPWRETGTRLLGIFIDSWFWLTIVPAALLILAIARRIGDYGITPDRYGLVLVAVWLALLAVYLAIRRNEADMRAILGGLAVLLLAGSFGPWGANGLTVTSQFSRLSALLEQKGLLKDNRMVSPSPDLDNDSRQAGYSMLYALKDAGGLNRLKPWFEGAKDDPFKDPETLESTYLFGDRNTWALADRISRKFGFTDYVPPADYVSFTANVPGSSDLPARARLVGPLQVLAYPAYFEAAETSALVKNGQLLVKSEGHLWSMSLESLLRQAKTALVKPANRQPPVKIAIAPDATLLFDNLSGQLGEKPQLHSARLWLILRQPPDGGT